MSQAAVSTDYHHQISIRSHEEQAAAFASAYSHSRRVRLLKRLIVAGSAGFVVLALGYSLFDPFSNLPKDVSIAKATLNGTKITMDHPRLSGFRKDGRPYQLLARSGVQDIRKPKIIDLNEIDATIKISDADTLKISAPAGRFDSEQDKMQLFSKNTDGKIRFKGSNYLMLLESADINFKTSIVVSKDPVSLVMSNGTIKADGLNVADQGKRIVFTGNVRSVISAPSGGMRKPAGAGTGNEGQ